MTTIATASATSTAPAAQFFALWADMDTWPEWNTDTEWVRLDGPFVQGATGTLKPKGGPKVKFTVEKLTATDFVDVSTLWGARLTFDHHIVETSSGTEVSVAVRMSGPLSKVWTMVMGGGLRKSAQADLDALVRAAEAKVAAQR
ncbi:SRPBCC family protein [Nakamurella panacisegetis]|nr:SRPBCC family protein [Nakamurella panacisegetis]